ncbi:hypothetical protein POM88_014661 [Heracleum sosnowskyi]|uniref:Uncharacterized protein n=1 Tax=Heracleum sosnowskyi TaxID=360622 RepID=A0AAD8IJT7_9APIA|nr:hypothetical protein POM88_014661 [Heracleum sosnowskyi]
MILENESFASIMLPCGLITSREAPMWHEGLLELLHTVISEAEDGSGVVQGSVPLALTCQKVMKILTKERKTGSRNIWQLFTNWRARHMEIADDADKMVYENEEELEGEEDNSKQLTEEMSRIYTSAPTNFLDRGRRNSVVVAREGFNELYIFSPGSSHNYYSMYA